MPFGSFRFALVVSAAAVSARQSIVDLAKARIDLQQAARRNPGSPAAGLLQGLERGEPAPPPSVQPTERQ